MERTIDKLPFNEPDSDFRQTVANIEPLSNLYTK